MTGGLTARIASRLRNSARLDHGGYCRRRERGFSLIVTLWIITVLVAVAIHFSYATRFDQLRCANAVSAVQARQATDAAIRYIMALLDSRNPMTSLPDTQIALVEAVPVGGATFWLVGRATDGDGSDHEPSFGFMDEGAKLNLNTATRDMLLALPGMTAELAATIVDWRDEDSEPLPGGAESETYLRLQPAYACKDGPFESVEELRLVYGISTDILYGRDRNLNGVIDAWEADGSMDILGQGTFPGADHGILEYVTVWSREANRRRDGSARINVNDRDGTQLLELLQSRFGTDVAARFTESAASRRSRYNSLLSFFLNSGLTIEQFAAIEDELTVSDDAVVEGLINVNTAPVEVLACLPGLDEDDARTLVAYRRLNEASLGSVAWVTEVLSAEKIERIAPHLTTRISQVSADIAAVGEGGRGFYRTLVVFDLSGSNVRVAYRRERTALGWCLGESIHQELHQ